MNQTFFALLLAIATLAAINVPSTHAQIFGKAIVVDGDTIVIDNVHIRFFGIDAPEKIQTCRTANDQIYKCGQQSKKYLRAIIGNQSVHCTDLGQAKFSRRWGRCFAGDVNLQAKMVQSGHARAYRFHSNEYISRQKTARRNRAGIWQGFHIRPGKFRKCWRSGGSARECSQ